MDEERVADRRLERQAPSSSSAPGPSAARTATAAPWMTGTSGTAPGSTCQRSQLPRIQVASSPSSRNSSTHSTGHAPKAE
ncbi:MAG TPA: hypothetical protein VNT55_07600 [Baekduia sp.]|nr:hypothetical protein [Baekduia sp.]